MKPAKTLKTSTLFCLLVLSPFISAAELVRDPLFHIERNKNANIVQYDAQLGSDGKLYAKEPVIAYWIRNANEGEIKELTWVQEKFAYGFKAKLDKKSNSAKVDMAADIGRSLVVKRNGDDYRAVGKIDGIECYLDKIFIQASGKGTSTKVEYIELFGTAISDQKKYHERFSP